MKKYLLFILLILSGLSFSFAETQRYVVANKDGKAKFVPVVKEGDKWKWEGVNNDLYVENGTEIEAFEIKGDRSLNYMGTPYVYRESMIAEYNGKYYVVVFPDKDLKPVDEEGNLTSGLGIRNYLSNTKLGDFYRTEAPGLLALLCGFISGVILIFRIKTLKDTFLMRWMFAIPLCTITVLEIGAAFSVGTDATWWVNPDDVGYWVATPLLFPYALVAVLMIFSYYFYNYMGRVDGPANVIVSALLIIGIVLTAISVIFVIINFLFTVCMLIAMGWMFKGIDVKNADGSTTNIGPLGSYRTDRYGNTKRIS